MTQMAQIAQIAACNRHHLVELRLRPWLLLTMDRMPASELARTQELGVSMLGVRRECVINAAGRLQGSD
jgi:hypothetical protein